MKKTIIKDNDLYEKLLANLPQVICLSLNIKHKWDYEFKKMISKLPMSYFNADENTWYVTRNDIVNMVCMDEEMFNKVTDSIDEVYRAGKGYEEFANRDESQEHNLLKLAYCLTLSSPNLEFFKFELEDIPVDTAISFQIERCRLQLSTFFNQDQIDNMNKMVMKSGGIKNSYLEREFVFVLSYESIYNCLDNLHMKDAIDAFENLPDNFKDEMVQYTCITDYSIY